MQRKEKGPAGKKRKSRASDEEKDETSEDEVLTKTKRRPKKVSCPTLVGSVTLHTRRVNLFVCYTQSKDTKTKKKKKRLGSASDVSLSSDESGGEAARGKLLVSTCTIKSRCTSHH